MALSSSILPENPIQTDPLTDVIQDIILDYVAGDIAESKSIYTVENRCTLFERNAKEKSYDMLALPYLLRYVVCGEQMQVQAIIEKYPEFLFKSGSANDYSGNTFVSFSPVELARFAHDVEMLEMMEPYANKVKGGKEKFAAILQKATEYEEAKKQNVYDFTGIIAAITGNNEAQRTNALNNFRQTFAPRVIENSEKSYNIKNLKKAYEMYVDHSKGWSVDRCALFWREVIGFLQRSLPACYAQAYCQGIRQVTECHEPLQRGLKLRHGKRFYPSDLSVSGALGFDFGVYITGVASSSPPEFVTPWGVGVDEHVFGSLCQAKATALHKLEQQSSKQAKMSACCSIL